MEGEMGRHKTSPSEDQKASRAKAEPKQSKAGEEVTGDGRWGEEKDIKERRGVEKVRGRKE